MIIISPKKMRYNRALSFLLTNFLLLLQCYVTRSDEFFCNINSKKMVHKVSEKFLSISIDPAVLFAGVNLSDSSLLLAQKISPAFIRLAGPSTPYVRYIDDEDFYQQMVEKSNNIYVTPSMWFGINEWFTMANLTPVFSINDFEREKGLWTPKNLESLIELSDKLDVNCYWQLGFDCANKSLTQYKGDLSILRQVLDKFPDHKNIWKIVGSDPRKCLSAFDAEVKEKLKSLDEIVDTIVTEQSSNPYEDDLFPLEDITIPLWTTVRKSAKPVTFSSALLWAKQVGEAARSKHDVIFRQPRLKELSHVTPVYWFSLLHKRLMGTTVLDIKPSSAKNSDTLIFAHCTKNQRHGAITVMAINDDVGKSIAKIRINTGFWEKPIAIKSYILTADSDESTEVYLNGQKLMMSQLHNFTLRPKIQRIKVLNQVSLYIPPKSIAFFDLSEARIPICMDNDGPILEAVNRNQEIVDNPNFQNRKTTLESIKSQMLEELKADNQFYEKSRDAPNQIHKFIEKNKEIYSTKKLNQPLKSHAEHDRNMFKLSIKEIENILKQRAKQKAAEKNVQLDSAELNMIVEKATINLPKKMFSKRETVTSIRSKRGINTLLLDEKADFYKKNMFSQETFEKIYKNEKHKRNIKKPKRSPHSDKIEISMTNKDLLDKHQIRRDINFDMLDKRSFSSGNNNKKPTFSVEELFNPNAMLARNKLSEKMIFESSEKKPNVSSFLSWNLPKNPKSTKQETNKENSRNIFNDFDVFNELGEFSYLDDIIFSSELPEKKKIDESGLLEMWREELKNTMKEESFESDTDYSFKYGTIRKKREINSNLRRKQLKMDMRKLKSNANSTPTKTIRKELKDMKRMKKRFKNNKIDTNSTPTKDDLRTKRKTIKKELKDTKRMKKKFKNENIDYIHRKRQYLKDRIYKLSNRHSSFPIMKLDNINNPEKRIKYSDTKKPDIDIIKQNYTLSKILNIEDKTVPKNGRLKRSVLENTIIDGPLQAIKSKIDESPIANDVRNTIADTVFDNVKPLSKFHDFSYTGHSFLSNNAVAESIFGTYKPLSLGFRPWKPSRILNLNHLNTLDPSNLILRRKRHIDNVDMSYINNLILDSEENKISGEDIPAQSKYLQNKKIEISSTLKENNESSSSERKENKRKDSIKISDRRKVNDSLNLARNIIDIATSEVKKGNARIGKEIGTSSTRTPIFAKGNVVGREASKNTFGNVLKKNASNSNAHSNYDKSEESFKDFSNNLAKINDKRIESTPRTFLGDDSTQSVTGIPYKNHPLLNQNNPLKKIVHGTKHLIGKLKRKISSLVGDIF